MKKRRIVLTIISFINFFVFLPPTLAANSKISTSLPARTAPLKTSTISSTITNKQTLSDQLAATITAAENYQNQLKAQLRQLKKQNAKLKHQLAAIREKLMIASAKTETASRQMVAPQPISAQSGFFQRFFLLILNNPMVDIRLAAGLIGLGLLLLVWLLWYRRPRLIESAEQAIEEDEYDFMGSDEAIPAKLDLARAYIEMEKIKEAEEVLEEITTKGHYAQQQEAKKMKEQLMKMR